MIIDPWGEILDRKHEGNGQGMYVSDHPDQLKTVERGYAQIVDRLKGLGASVSRLA